MKELKMPISLLQQIALAGRIVPEHISLYQIEGDVRKGLAGYKGEKAIAYHLKRLSRDRYIILHDLRLKISDTYFQMDVLILTSHCFIITEVKNIHGTLYFDPVFNQLIRSKDGIEEGFQDPSNQVKRTQVLLLQWLEMNNLPHAPLHSFIGIGDPKTILKTSLNNHKISKSISHGIELPFKIESLEKIYRERVVSEKDLKRIARRLIKKNEPLVLDIFEKYNITPSDLLTGVRCPKCKRLAMNREHGTWICHSCNHKDKRAHIDCVIDYALLINNNFSNREISKFLHLKSMYTTNRLLKEMAVICNGRKYSLTHEFMIDHHSQIFR